jgi:hypothetical protein
MFLLRIFAERNRGDLGFRLQSGSGCCFEVVEVFLFNFG